MAERAYIDVDIVLRTSGAQYEAHVSTGSRTASSTFPLPFTERELDDFFSIFGGRRVRRMESPQLERARAFGGRLYRAVFNDELDELLATSLSEAGESGHGLRIRLDLDDAPDLVNVPWEYLYRPASDDFFALSNWTPIVRYLDIETRMPPAPIEPPLRILVMISDPIEYQGSLDVEREWERLQESLADLVADGHVELHRLERATERELLRELRRNDHHIFHFIGHGEFNEQEQDGVLLLEDEHRRTKLVTGRALGTVLRDSRSMRLVVLNNCEGARASDSDPFAGAAQSLLQKGMPAVAAMQFEVTDRAAISFAHEFYAGLSDGYPADAALAEARKAIYQGATQYEFGSPVLYLSADDGVIFDITSRPTPSPEFDAELTLAEPDTPTLVDDAPPTVSSSTASLMGTRPSEELGSAEQNSIVPEGHAVPAGHAPTVEMQPTPATPPAGGRNRKALFGVVGALVAVAVIVFAVLASRTDDVTATTIAVVAETTLPATTAPATTAGAVVVQEPVEPTPADPPTIADFTTIPPTIDGSDEEWTSRFLFSSSHEVFGQENIDGLDDLDADWRVAWDHDALYVHASVFDDTIAQENTGPSLFRGDAIAFYFDTDPTDDTPDAQLTTDDVAFFLAPSEGQNWVRLVPTANGGSFGSEGALSDDPGVVVATDFFADGYNMEAKIPWRLLGVSDPEEGQRFRMTLDVSDNDTPGASQQDSMISISVGRTAAAQAFPAVWEELVLAG